MAGLRRVVERIKTQFTRAVNWVRTVRTDTLLRTDAPLGSEGTPGDAASTNSKAGRVSLTREELWLHTSIFKSNFTEMRRVSLAHLPPAKGLLKLVEILCKNTSGSYQP